MNDTARWPDATWPDVWDPPASVWAELNDFAREDQNEATVTIHGVSGASITVDGLDDEPTLVTPVKLLSWGMAFRLRLVLAWAGLALLTFACASVFVAVAWEAPSAAGLAGGLGLIGSVSMLGSAARS